MVGLAPVPGGTKERSRLAVEGARLPKSLQLAIDLMADTTERAGLEAFARKLLAERQAFEHRQMRRREGVGR